MSAGDMTPPNSCVFPPVQAPSPCTIKITYIDPEIPQYVCPLQAQCQDDRKLNLL